MTRKPPAELPRCCPLCGGKLIWSRHYIVSDMRLVDPTTGRLGKSHLKRITGTTDQRPMLSCIQKHCTWHMDVKE